MSRLIIISNRLPVSIDKTDGDIVVRQSTGGLVSALKSYLNGTLKKGALFQNPIWIGSADATTEDWNLISNKKALQDNFTMAPVFVDKLTYDAFYYGFSNATLWPLFHDFQNLAVYEEELFDAYKNVNRQFAEKAIAIYQPGDIVWVHDYHLLLVPQLIRNALPNARIGFFLHIPFPSKELFGLMPGHWERALLEGALGADVLGFHIRDYGQHFIESTTKVLAVESQCNTLYYQNRMVKIESFPIGIDYDRFKQAAMSKPVTSSRARLQKIVTQQKIIFSADRLDYIKGLDCRLEAYDTFLKSHTEWHEKVVFVLNVVPSRDVIPAYKQLKTLLEEKVRILNSRYATLYWQPIIYRYDHLHFDALCALYQAADVALVTPLRDGMNLIAKEYIASCADIGVLILSTQAGAAKELTEALLVNPLNVAEIAQAIENALTMPAAEQQTRLAALQKQVRDNDVFKWGTDFLNGLLSMEKAVTLKP